MTINSEPPCRRRVFADPRTGREIWQITDWESDQFTTYMYGQAFSGDERYLAFSSDRGGRKALHRLEIDTGAVAMLSGEEGIAGMTLNMHPGGREIYYIDASHRRLFAADIYTLERRSVASLDHPDWGRIAGLPGFSGDGRKVCCTMFTTGDRGGVLVADCAGGRFDEIFRRQESIQHVQFCPGPDYLISFAVHPDYQNKPDRQPAERARCWLLDCETRRAWPFLIAPPGFRATHEYWNRRGTRLYFHKKTVPSWTPNWVCSMDVSGGDFKEHLCSGTRRLGHSSVTADESWLVSDSQDPGENELTLVDLKSGRSEILCWPNASIEIGRHVHPSFSPSGSKVLYTSDSTGHMQLYIVPLK